MAFPVLGFLCAFACFCSSSASPALSSSLAGPVDTLHCPDIATVESLRSGPVDNETLRIVVPWKTSFLTNQFVRFSPHNCTLSGFSMDVFLRAVPHVRDPRMRNLRFVMWGDGTQAPVYDDMIDMLLDKKVDGVVGDLTITRDRSQNVGFTVPYLASSLVLITPMRTAKHGTLWDFLRPFSEELWITLLACLVATGFVLYWLEDGNPDFSKSLSKQEDCIQESTDKGTPFQGLEFIVSPYISLQDQNSQALQNSPVRVQSAQDNYSNLLVQDISSLQRPGPPIYDQASYIRRVMNAFWFTSLCVFQSQQESVRTHLGRVAAVMWLFTMLIFTASYTATLTSILSAQGSYPTIAGFQALLSNTNISVGCLKGSFVENYMQKLNLRTHTIKTFNSTTQYAEALQKGNADGVGAVLDEAPYTLQVLQTHCDLTKSSRNDDNLPSFGGFGFAFRKGDALIDELSYVMLRMAENGTLKKLQDLWKVGDASGGGCGSGTNLSLGLESFGGLFGIVGGIYVVCVAWRLLYKGGRSLERSCSLLHTAPAESIVDKGTQSLSLNRRGHRVHAELQEQQIELQEQQIEPAADQEAAHTA